ncbi:Melibiose/raffinose/stachyose import permease protein MelD [subsurface metagenome]
MEKQFLKVHLKYLFIIPTLVVLVLVILFPLLYTLYISFHEYILIRGIGKFVAFNNYVEEVFFEAKSLVSLKNTLVYTGSVVSLEFVGAFGLALLLNVRDLKFRNVYLIILMIPVMITPVAVGLMWKLFLNPDLGIVNYFLGLFGVPKRGWFGDPELAMPTLIAVDVWHETSLILMILAAGLANLRREPFEAATVDGASSLQKFRFITVPLMSPVILVAIMIRMISALKTYDLVYICTRGGPGTKTETLSYYIYRTAFRKLDMGHASALAYLLLFLILILALVLVKILGRETT